MQRSNDDWKLVLLFLVVIAATAVVGWHIGQREGAPNLPLETSKFTIAITLAGGATGLMTLYLVFRRTRATERNSAAALEAVENGRKSLEQARISELAGRFQKGLELLDKEGLATRIGGIHVLQDVAIAAPEQYADSVLRTLSSFMTRQCEEDWGILNDYFTPPADDGPPAPDRDRERFHWTERQPPAIGGSPDDLKSALRAFAAVIGSTDAGAAPVRARRLTRLTLSDVGAIDEMRLVGVDFDQCYFWNAVFLQSDFSESRFFGCRFDNCQIFECRFTNAQISLSGRATDARAHDTLYLLRCDLTNASLATDSVHMTECDLSDSIVRAETQLDVSDCWHIGGRPHFHSRRNNSTHVVVDASGLEPFGKTATGMPLYRLHA